MQISQKVQYSNIRVNMRYEVRGYIIVWYGLQHTKDVKREALSSVTAAEVEVTATTTGRHVVRVIWHVMVGLAVTGTRPKGG